MNREKKQLVVVGALVFLVLSVGAFQFTRKDPPPPVASTKKEARPANATDKPEVVQKKYIELTDLPSRDPFEIASFVAGSKPAPTPPVLATSNPGHTGGTSVNDPTKKKLVTLPFQESGTKWTPDGVGDIKPIEPPKPIFGYSLVGIVEGSHPMAVFDDGKGNQQLVEAGQSIGSSATVTTISRGKVRVKFNAETLVLNVGGNPNAK